MTVDRSSESIQVVCFTVAGQHYALDIMRVKEIINPPAITAVPGAPDFVEGMIELRGAFMAVIDLRKRFGVASTPLDGDSKFIVVTLNQEFEQILALVVDGVLDVRRFGARDIRPAPRAVVAPGGPRSHFVIGVVRSGEQIIMLVELDALLSPDEHHQLGGLPGAG